MPIPTRVLVTGMRHDDGEIVAAELYAVAEACGQTSEQVRSCLRRLVKEGLYVQHGKGRDARYEATEAGSRPSRDWLGPHSHRLSARRRRAGLGPHVAPRSHSRCPRTGGQRAISCVIASSRSAAPRCRAVCTCRPTRGTTPSATKPSVSMSPTICRSRRPTISRSEVCAIPRQLARTLWPIDEVARAYEAFIAQHRHVPEQLEDMRRNKERFSDDHFLPFAFAMAVAMSECTRNDPLLPPELLPRPWPGRSARELVLRSRRLALMVREEHDRPALFHLYDLMVEGLS